MPRVEACAHTKLSQNVLFDVSINALPRADCTSAIATYNTYPEPVNDKHVVPYKTMKLAARANNGTTERTWYDEVADTARPNHPRPLSFVHFGPRRLILTAT